MSKEYTIRVMTLEDYDEVYALWMGIHGFGIRSIDDSKEGVERFLKRNPTTSMVAVADGKIVGAILRVSRHVRRESRPQSFPPPPLPCWWSDYVL